MIATCFRAMVEGSAYCWVAIPYLGRPARSPLYLVQLRFEFERKGLQESPFSPFEAL